MVHGVSPAGSVSLINGANALEFGGDAIGGVIVVNPRRVFRKDTIYGRAILNGRTNGRGYGVNAAFTNSWKNGWFVSILGSTTQNGDFEAPDYLLSNTGNLSSSSTFLISIESETRRIRLECFLKRVIE